jgi:hypothetical protein
MIDDANSAKKKIEDGAGLMPFGQRTSLFFGENENRISLFVYLYYQIFFFFDSIKVFLKIFC